MAEWVIVFATEPDGLRLIPETCMVDGEKQLPKKGQVTSAPSLPTYTQ